MHAALGFQPAIGIGAVDPNCRRFYTGFFATALFKPLSLVVMGFRPADIHPQQHFSPILRLSAAGPGMHLEIAVVAIGFAGEKAFELASCRFRAQSLECRLGIGDHASIAFGLAELDQFEGFGDFPLDALVAADRLVESRALAEQLLCRFGIVPQAWIFDLSVQLREAASCGIPVKDASSAAPTTC